MNFSRAGTNFRLGRTNLTINRCRLNIQTVVSAQSWGSRRGIRPNRIAALVLTAPLSEFHTFTKLGHQQTEQI